MKKISKEPKVSILDPYSKISPGLFSVSDKIFGKGVFKDHFEVFAVCRGQIVGIFTFNFYFDKKQMWSRGTAVDEAFQRKGIGAKFWRYAIEKYRPEYISSCIVSDGGNNFIEKIKKNYPEITWDVW